MQFMALIMMMAAICAITFDEIASENPPRIKYLSNHPHVTLGEYPHGSSDETGNKYQKYSDYGIDTGFSTREAKQNSNGNQPGIPTEKHFGTESWNIGYGVNRKVSFKHDGHGWNAGIRPYQSFPQLPQGHFPYGGYFYGGYGQRYSTLGSDVSSSSTTETSATSSPFPLNVEVSGIGRSIRFKDVPGSIVPDMKVKSEGTEHSNGGNHDVSKEGGSTTRASYSGIVNAWHLRHDGTQMQRGALKWPSTENFNFYDYEYLRPVPRNRHYQPYPMRWYPSEEYYDYPYELNYEYGYTTEKPTTPATPIRNVSEEVSSIEINDCSDQANNGTSVCGSKESENKPFDESSSLEESIDATSLDESKKVTTETSNSGIEFLKTEPSGAGILTENSAGARMRFKMDYIQEIGNESSGEVNNANMNEVISESTGSSTYGGRSISEEGESVEMSNERGLSLEKMDETAKDLKEESSVIRDLQTKEHGLDFSVGGSNTSNVEPSMTEGIGNKDLQISEHGLDVTVDGSNSTNVELSMSEGKGYENATEIVSDLHSTTKGSSDTNSSKNSLKKRISFFISLLRAILNRKPKDI